MTDHTPLTDQQLDEYETLANAATPGPWGIYEYGGGNLIDIAADLEETGCGYRARRAIASLEDEPLDNDPTHPEWTAEQDWAQVQADAAYIAALSPEVARALVAEVRRLRAQVTELEAGIQWRDEERRRWVDVHNLVERAIDKGWSTVDTLDLEAELGPAPAAVPAAAEGAER